MKSKYGVVTNDERLARVVLHPRHVRGNGEAKPGLFPITHFVTPGVSFVRADRIDETELQKQGENVAASATAKPSEPQTLKGFMLANTGQVRDVKDEKGQQWLCVIDDPVDGNEAHSSAQQSGNTPDPKPADDTYLRELREKVVNCFGPIKTAAEAYTSKP